MAKKRTPRMEDHILWLATHSDLFLSKHVDDLDPDIYSGLEEQWLLRLAKQYYLKYKKPVPERVIELKLAKKPENSTFDKDVVWELYLDGEPSEDVERFLIDEAPTYFKRLHARLLMEEAADSLGREEVDDAVDILAEGIRQLTRQKHLQTRWTSSKSKRQFNGWPTSSTTTGRLSLQGSMGWMSGSAGGFAPESSEFCLALQGRVSRSG